MIDGSLVALLTVKEGRLIAEEANQHGGMLLKDLIVTLHKGIGHIIGVDSCLRRRHDCRVSTLI